MTNRPRRQRTTSSRRNHKPGWERVSTWYDGMVGNDGSRTHQTIAIPAVLSLLDTKPGNTILDLGAGQGVLAPHIHAKRAIYTGVDISTTLIQQARARHGAHGTFFVGDISSLPSIPGITAGSYNSVVFMLSIQDIRHMEKAISSAAWALKQGGRLVILMTHPAFRIPRQSGWGYDKERKLTYRRVDSYLSRMDIPLRPHYSGGTPLTRSYHRPIQDYVAAIIKSNLCIDAYVEIPPGAESSAKISNSEKKAYREIPLFLALRARKL